MSRALGGCGGGRLRHGPSGFSQQLGEFCRGSRHLSTSSAEAACHTWTVSPPIEIKALPSAVNATGWPPPASVARSCPVTASHNLGPSALPEARVLPSGENTTLP